MEQNPYQIFEYQPGWAAEFELLANQLRQVLGELALRIDHIGSTSVPGLAAKDIIDIQVTVNRLDDEILNRLKSAGYIHNEEVTADHRPPEKIGPDSDWHKFFFHPPQGVRHTHIHIRAAGKPNQQYPLLFRDYLRSHPQTAQAYAELKRRLCATLADLSTYPDVKDPAVDLIYFAAEDWARQTGWTPGPADA